jgi:hypothetical protein
MVKLIKKTIVFLSALAILGSAAAAYAAQPVDDFAGIIWGAGSELVEREMSLRGSVRYPTKLDIPNQTMDYYRGNFDGHQALLAFIFKNGKLYSGWADFSDVPNPKNANSTRNYYVALVNHYTDKFGPPTKGPEDGYDAKNVWMYGMTFWDNLTSGDPTLKVQVNVNTGLRSDGKLHVIYSAESK